MTTRFVVFTPSGKRGEIAEATACSTRRASSASISTRCAADAASADAARSTSPRANSPNTPSSPRATMSRRGARSSSAMSTSGPPPPGRRLGCQAESAAISSSTSRQESQVHRQVVRKRAETHPIEIDPVVRLHYVEVARARHARSVQRFSSIADGLERTMGYRRGERESRRASGICRRRCAPANGRSPSRCARARNRRDLARLSTSAPMASLSTSARPPSPPICATSRPARSSPRPAR